MLAEDGDPAAMIRLAEYEEEIKEPPFWCTAYYQAYYDLVSHVGMGETVISWRDVSEYCKDIGVPEEAERMFDILRGVHTRIKSGTATNSTKSS